MNDCQLWYVVPSGTYVTVISDKEEVVLLDPSVLRLDLKRREYHENIRFNDLVLTSLNNWLSKS